MYGFLSKLHKAPINYRDRHSLRSRAEKGHNLIYTTPGHNNTFNIRLLTLPLFWRGLNG